MIFIGAGATLEAMLGAYLVRKFVGYPNALLHEKDLLLFLGLAGPLSCLISATFGTIGLFLGGQSPLEPVANQLGDMVGRRFDRGFGFCSNAHDLDG